MNQTHLGEETYEEKIFIEEGVMVRTHKQAIARLMWRMLFSQGRDPMTVLEVQPLCLTSEIQAGGDAFSAYGIWL